MDAPPVYREEYDAMERSLYENVGRAMSAWGNLEFHLSCLFGASIGLDIIQACKMLAHAKNFSLTLSLIDTAVRGRITSENGSPERWISLVEYIRELSGDRNFIAHSQKVETGYAVVTKKHNIPAQPVLATVTASLAGVQPGIMAIEEVAELQLDFVYASDLCRDFHHQLLTRPLPDIFAQSIVRRRRPRAQRRGSARKARTHPPQSFR